MSDHIKNMLSNFINGNKEHAALDLRSLLIDKLRVTEAQDDYKPELKEGFDDDDDDEEETTAYVRLISHSGNDIREDHMESLLSDIGGQQFFSKGDRLYFNIPDCHESVDQLEDKIRDILGSDFDVSVTYTDGEY